MQMKKVAIWGDSLAKGVVWNPERKRHTFLNCNAVTVVAEKLGLDIQNRARFGYTAPRGLEIMEKDIAGGLHCESALIEFGGNDCNYAWDEISFNPEGTHLPATSPEKFYTTVCRMVTLLKDAHIKPFLMTLPPIDAEKYFRFLVGDKLNAGNILRWLGDVQQIYRFQELYSDLIEKAARAMECSLLDVRSHCLMEHRMASFLCSDGLHLNQEGQEFIGDKIATMILEGV